MKDYLRLIDTQTLGARCDVTPVFADPVAWAHLIADLSQPFSSTALDYVAGIDALGFILGAAIALYLKKGFIPIRKGGKLPVAVISTDFIDYTQQQKTLELRQGLIKAGDKILVVDEWVETGAQMQAAIDLIEQAGGIVIGFATINIDHTPGAMRLQTKYKGHALWQDMQ